MSSDSGCAVKVWMEMTAVNLEQRVKGSVLVVDDYEALREKLEDILGPYFDVTQKDNYRRGVSEYLKGDFTLALVDNTMHGRCVGQDFLERASRHDKRTPIIVIIDRNDLGSKILHPKEYGAADIITKPFKNEEVLEVVEHVLAGKRLLPKLRAKASQLKTKLYRGRAKPARVEDWMGELGDWHERRRYSDILNVLGFQVMRDKDKLTGSETVFYCGPYNNEVYVIDLGRDTHLALKIDTKVSRRLIKEFETVDAYQLYLRENHKEGYVNLPEVLGARHEENLFDLLLLGWPYPASQGHYGPTLYSVLRDEKAGSKRAYALLEDAVRQAARIHKIGRELLREGKITPTHGIFLTAGDYTWRFKTYCLDKVDFLDEEGRKICKNRILEWYRVCVAPVLSLDNMPAEFVSLYKDISPPNNYVTSEDKIIMGDWDRTRVKLCQTDLAILFDYYGLKVSPEEEQRLIEDVYIPEMFGELEEESFTKFMIGMYFGGFHKAAIHGANMSYHILCGEKGENGGLGTRHVEDAVFAIHPWSSKTPDETAANARAKQLHDFHTATMRLQDGIHSDFIPVEYQNMLSQGKEFLNISSIVPLWRPEDV